MIKKPVLQAEPNKKRLWVTALWRFATVFLRLAVFVTAKPSQMRKEQKSFSQIEAKEKKVTAVSKWALKITSGGSADMDQTAAKITWFWSISQWWTKRRAQLREFLVRNGAGRFWRGLVHMKTEISNFFTMVVPKRKMGFSVFCFSVRKQKTVTKNIFSPKVVLVRPWHERPRKNIQSHTWDFFRTT